LSGSAETRGHVVLKICSAHAISARQCAAFHTLAACNIRMILDDAKFCVEIIRRGGSSVIAALMQMLAVENERTC
jgi:hypothetical protein